MQFGANINIELRDMLLKYSKRDYIPLNNNLFFSKNDLYIFKKKFLKYKNGEKIVFPWFFFNKKSDWIGIESSSLRQLFKVFK